MRKILTTIRFAALLVAAVVLIFSFSLIERLKVLTGKEAKADVPGGGASSGSTTSGDSSGGSGDSGGDSS